MVTVKAITEWVRHDLSFDSVPLTTGPMERTGMSNAHVRVTAVAGPGFTVEEAFSVKALQFRVVGPQASDEAVSYGKAEALALDLDRRLMTADMPSTVDGHHLLRVFRLGSEPAFLQVDDGDRTHFTCNYGFEISTGY